MENMLSQGMPLALFGIGIVFAFLCLLVLATWAMSVLTERWLPIHGKAATQTARSAPTAAQMAAIIAALSLHRQRRDAGHSTQVNLSRNHP